MKSRDRTVRGLTLLIGLTLWVGACTPTRSTETSFPIIGNDQSGLVETMEWGLTPVSTPIQTEASEVVETLDTSTPHVVQIAVVGGTCPPSAQVLVTGPPEMLSVAMVLGAAIAPEGVECGETPTTHTLVIRFNEPIAIDALTVSATRTR